MKKKIEWPELGEIVSLVVSSLLLAAIIAFLVYDMVQADTEMRPVRAYPVLEQAQAVEGGYIMPIRVENRARQTIPRLLVHVEIGTGADRDNRDVEMTYMGGNTHRDFFLYLKKPTAGKDIQITPEHYTLD